MRGTGHPADNVGGDPVDPRIHLVRKNFLRKRMDCRVISAFTRVFNALCPAMTMLAMTGSSASRNTADVDFGRSLRLPRQRDVL
jgi:hypothetical protein